ncbi:hypothetical protein HKX48_007677 [Thoreauomyces humboldtii]|nr:hypothetical protein HKX48_007677 [Thoreauomyces humboldtii]
MPWRVRTPVSPQPASSLSDAPTKEGAQRAYEVWVSEIMLQQTQVSTVIPYYNRWIEKWPTIHALAVADEEQVHQQWSGLGYYSRARRLREGARLVVERFDGRLPRDPAVLEKEVPGVGPYTAGAIASIAYNVAAPLVDGNVVRVLSRMRSFAADPKSKHAVAWHWTTAKAILDPNRPGHFNQALMDLGATVCTPVNPDCPGCPVKDSCRANAESKAIESLARDRLTRPSEIMKPELLDTDPCTLCPPLQDIEDAGVSRYPAKPKKKAPRLELCVVSILEHRQTGEATRFLLVKGPKEGLLANLWDFPNVIVATSSSTVTNDPHEADDALSITYGERKLLTDKWLERHAGITLLPSATTTRTDLGSAIHLFSHIRREMLVEHLLVDGPLHVPIPDTPREDEQEEENESGTKRKRGEQKPGKRNSKIKGKDAGKRKEGANEEEERRRQIRWFTEDEMMGEGQDAAAVPATLKKAFLLLRKQAGGGKPKTVAPKTRKKRKLVKEEEEEEDEEETEDEEDEGDSVDNADAKKRKVKKAKQSSTSGPAGKGRVTRSMGMRQPSIAGFFGPKVG